jgi:F-type H+-transporting ATPase subunit gamma
MANLKEIRSRIASVTSTRQITSAMKMVSAAKLKRAQDSVVQLRPYISKMTELVGHLYNVSEGSEDKLYFKPRNEGKILIVLIASNRGLCGAFNSNVIKMALTLANETYHQQFSSKNLQFLCIGKSCYDFFKSKNYSIAASYIGIVEKPNFNTAATIADDIIKQYGEGKFDKVILVYNKFKNAAVQQLVSEQFLPVPTPPKKEKLAKGKLNYQNDFIIEPDKGEIINEVVPLYLRTLFFSAILDSVASEHGARMTAMHKATDNATELIRELTLNYNKARQASITNEILEIVGGAEALKG